MIYGYTKNSIVQLSALALLCMGHCVGSEYMAQREHELRIAEEQSLLKSPLVSDRAAHVWHAQIRRMKQWNMGKEFQELLVFFEDVVRQFEDEIVSLRRTLFNGDKWDRPVHVLVQGDVIPVNAFYFDNTSSINMGKVQSVGASINGFVRTTDRVLGTLVKRALAVQCFLSGCKSMRELMVQAFGRFSNCVRRIKDDYQEFAAICEENATY